MNERGRLGIYTSNTNGRYPAYNHRIYAKTPYIRWLYAKFRLIRPFGFWQPVLLVYTPYILWLSLIFFAYTPKESTQFWVSVFMSYCYNNKCITCPVCNYSFKKNFNFKRHILYTEILIALKVIVEAFTRHLTQHGVVVCARWCRRRDKWLHKNWAELERHLEQKHSS